MNKYLRSTPPPLPPRTRTPEPFIKKSVNDKSPRNPILQQANETIQLLKGKKQISITPTRQRPIGIYTSRDSATYRCSKSPDWTPSRRVIGQNQSFSMSELPRTSKAVTVQRRRDPILDGTLRKDPTKKLWTNPKASEQLRQYNQKVHSRILGTQGSLTGKKINQSKNKSNVQLNIDFNHPVDKIAPSRKAFGVQNDSVSSVIRNSYAVPAKTERQQNNRLIQDFYSAKSKATEFRDRQNRSSILF